MAEYKLVGKKSVVGKKKLVYSKVGSRKLYVKSKGRMMNLVKYKKMKDKKVSKRKVSKRKVSKTGGRSVQAELRRRKMLKQAKKLHKRGGTYTGTSTQPTMEQWENIFGPAGRDIKTDQQGNKRHQRWHLPDALKGHNQYLTERIDG